jgi:uncharacterized cupin superfamily protein
MVEEAKLIETEGGLEPETQGWFVVNVADTAWWQSDAFGASCPFEAAGGPEEHRFPEYGINIHVVWPGQANCMYHGEEAQEDFLVLSGECILLIEGEERPLRAWDFVHFPAWTEHVIVGSGSGPSAILMVGTRGEGLGVRYTVAEIAQKHGAGGEQETTEPREAYARFPQWERAPLENAGLPWQ